jgi:hypothetical protein
LGDSGTGLLACDFTIFRGILWLDWRKRDNSDVFKSLSGILMARGG